MNDSNDKDLEQQIDGLLGQLAVHDWTTNRKVAEELGGLGPAAVPRLIRALSHPDGYVRSAAADALGKTKDARAVEPLIAAMQFRDGRVYEDDEDAEARLNAAIALGEIGDLRALGDLLQTATGKDLLLASYAIDALGMLRDIRAVPTLIEALRVPDLDVPKAARSALIRIGAPAVLPLIESLQSANGYWRIHAIRALGGIGDARALNSIRHLLDDADEQVRLTATQALAKLQQNKA